MFLLKYTQNREVLNLEALGRYFDRYLFPFVSLLTKSQASFQHLEFAGCGATQITDMTLEDVLFHTYGGLFMAGFDSSELSKVELPASIFDELFMPCMNNPEKIQIRMKNSDVLTDFLTGKGIAEPVKSQITQLYEGNKLSSEKIKEQCIALRPFMAELFDVWDNSNMKSFTLTSVGMAIGHANVKRQTGTFAELSIWIN